MEGQNFHTSNVFLAAHVKDVKLNYKVFLKGVP